MNNGVLSVLKGLAGLGLVLFNIPALAYLFNSNVPKDQFGNPIVVTHPGYQIFFLLLGLILLAYFVWDLLKKRA